MSEQVNDLYWNDNDLVIEMADGRTEIYKGAYITSHTSTYDLNDAILVTNFDPYQSGNNE